MLNNGGLNGQDKGKGLATSFRGGVHFGDPVPPKCDTGTTQEYVGFRGFQKLGSPSGSPIHSGLQHRVQNRAHRVMETPKSSARPSSTVDR